MRISIDAFGEQELSRELLRFVDRAEDMRPAFSMVHERFFQLEMDQFDSGGKYSGGWAPLAASTLAGKQRAGLGVNILVATGRLKASLTSSSEDALYEATADGAMFGSSVPYGVFHQSREPRHHLPRRAPVAIPDTEKVEWIKILQRFLIEGHE